VGDDTRGTRTRDARRCADAPSTQTATHAVTVDAPPEDIWPWLVQIGNHRGGLYSYDWLDRLFGFLDRPSATRILPEFQQLAVGDTILLGREELSVAYSNRLAHSLCANRLTAWSGYGSSACIHSSWGFRARFLRGRLSGIALLGSESRPGFGSRSSSSGSGYQSSDSSAS
jgi:hypothetical protein